MKILLVQPKLERSFFGDIRLPPLGLAFLAGVLREAGHEVRILDAILTRRQLSAIAEAAGDFEPEVVGVSATSPLAGTACRIAALVKTIVPAATTVLGGVHPTLFPEDMLREPAVDYVIRGEGESSLAALVDILAGGGRPDRVDGLAFRRNGEVVVNPPAAPPPDLDALPFPAYDLFPIRKYYSLQIAEHPFGSMITSRGCPYQCIFCSARATMGARYRAYSPRRIVAEIRFLVDRFQVREILFKDSEFTLDPARVEAFCELLLAEGLRVRWSCNGRIGRASLALLEKMRAAGCRLIEYGIESGDDEILETLDKRITVDQVRETFALTRRAGLKTIANFMIGNPGETRRSVEKTLRLANEIRPDFCDFSFATALPGTRLYTMALENGWLLKSYDPSHIRLDECVMNATRMSLTELRRMFKKAYRSFYLRPGYILDRAARLHPFEWKMSAIGMLRVLGLRQR